VGVRAACRVDLIKEFASPEAELAGDVLAAASPRGAPLDARAAAIRPVSYDPGSTLASSRPSWRIALVDDRHASQPLAHHHFDQDGDR
jgi:hypothetical protein